MKINRLKTSVCLGALSMVFALSLALTLGSCTKDPLGQGEQPNSEYVDLTLELTPPGAFTPVGTRAMSDPEQNAIKSAAVLVFQKDILQYHESGIITNTSGATKSLKVTLKTSQDEADLFDIMVIGNPPTFAFAEYVGKSKDELKAALTFSITGKWASEFVMYGEAFNTLVKRTANVFKIQMLRSLARIDIGVGWYRGDGTWRGLNGRFELSEVRVYNTSNKFAVIPTATMLNASGKVAVDAPTIPIGTDINADPWIYPSQDIVDGSYIQSTIFLAEALKDETKGVTLVVGGKYGEGKTITYYRIDMCLPVAVADGMRYHYLDILRNHLYRITITDVSGEGFITPEEALTSDPINITTILTPIEEGGTGDVVFDGKNSILTDVSSVLIYGEPDGVKSYDMFTAKATFEAGTSATISGPGSSLIGLVNGVTRKISHVIPKGTTSGSYTITVDRLSKVIKFTVQPPVDAHFDFLPFMNVASIIVENPEPWLTLSQNRTYVKSEQQSSQVLGNSAGEACLHFDENIVHEDEPPRTARALVHRKKGTDGTTGVILEQLNLSGMVLGKFGGSKDNYGYTQQLAVEAVEEFNERTYDDGGAHHLENGMQWGFDGTLTGANNIHHGREWTMKLAKLAGSGITTAPYAARYCYDKNRDTDGNGKIDDAEVVWYLPAQNQLMGALIVNDALTVKLFSGKYYWSATEYNISNSWFVYVGNGYTYFQSKFYSIYNVRCVRDI